MPAPKTRVNTGASAINLAIVATEIEHIKSDASDIKDVLRQMSTSLQGLTRIEERQLGVVAALEKSDKIHEGHESRIAKVETELPQLREMRSWVIKGVSAGVSMLFAGLCALTFGVFADRYIPKQYVQSLVSSPNVTPPAVHPQ